MSTNSQHKLKTSFHRTFPLQRAPLAEYLRATADEGRALTFDEIRSKTSLGTVKVESMRRYSRAAGLTDHRDALTELGKLVVRHDPYLNALTSTWLLHVAMVSDGSVAPEFWRECWHQARLGEVLDRSTLAEWVGQCRVSDEINSKTAEEAATVFLTTYSKNECLGDIGLLAKVTQGYQVKPIEADPPLGVIAWFVCEQWHRSFGSQMSVELEGFRFKSKLAESFKLSTERCNTLLRKLADFHLCDLYLSAPPFQIVRTWDTPSDLIEKIYDLH